jgi:ribosomal protein S20
MADRLALVLEEIDYLLAEQRELAFQGPQFVIVHKTDPRPGLEELRAGCLPEEKLLGVLLMYHGQERQLRLSPAEAALFNYVAQYRIGQTASQIERGIRSDPFIAAQRLRARTSNRRNARFHRTTIKTYVKRIRAALASAFTDVGLRLDPESVMVAQRTVGNEVAYTIRARVEWRHVAGTVTFKSESKSITLGEFGSAHLGSRRRGSRKSRC